MAPDIPKASDGQFGRRRDRQRIAGSSPSQNADQGTAGCHGPAATIASPWFSSDTVFLLSLEHVPTTCLTLSAAKRHARTLCSRVLGRLIGPLTKRIV